MLFKRKIYNKFLAWKQEANGQKALLVEGARRIGKSTVVEEFAKNEYKSYILIDFAKAPENVKSYFQLHLNDLDTFYSVTYVLDKSRLSIRLVPPYSEERLAAAREYAKEHGFQVIQTEEKIA